MVPEKKTLTQKLAGQGSPAIFGSHPRFWEFFTVHIRNPHTRRAYFRSVRFFSDWCQAYGLSLAEIQPFHIAAYIEMLGQTRSKPTVKQSLAAVRMLFDWLVVGQVTSTNPASAVRGPKHSTGKGKAPILTADEMRQLLGSIETSTIKGLRDRALIALMAYTFARVGAAVGLTVADFYIEGRRGWVRLHEKGGKVTAMPCHHNLEAYLDAYLASAGLGVEPHAPLFPTIRGGILTRSPLAQSNVHKMLRRRAAAAGIRTLLACHSLRATGITTYLGNGGKLEIAQWMAGHSSPRTTSLYDRRSDAVGLDEVERIIY